MCVKCVYISLYIDKYIYTYMYALSQQIVDPSRCWGPGALHLLKWCVALAPGPGKDSTTECTSHDEAGEVGEELQENPQREGVIMDVSFTVSLRCVQRANSLKAILKIHKASDSLTSRMKRKKARA